MIPARKSLPTAGPQTCGFSPMTNRPIDKAVAEAARSATTVISASSTNQSRFRSTSLAANGVSNSIHAASFSSTFSPSRIPEETTMRLGQLVGGMTGGSRRRTTVPDKSSKTTTAVTSSLIKEKRSKSYLQQENSSVNRMMRF